MRRWSSQRAARRDLSQIGEAQARALLEEHADAIAWSTRYYRAWGAQVGLEMSDLRSLARVAVLEAALSYRDSSAASLRTWVRRNIRWRLVEALEGGERPEEPLDEPERVVNGQSPEELVARLRAIGWVRQQIDGLEVRQRTILACRLEGETMREIAATLGISATRVHQESTEALATLRKRAAHELLDEE